MVGFIPVVPINSHLDSTTQQINNDCYGILGLVQGDNIPSASCTMEPAQVLILVV